MTEVEKLEKRSEFRDKNLTDAKKKSTVNYTGFIAQEFNKELLGSESKEIDYNKVMVAMWLKIQELEKRIKKLS